MNMKSALLGIDLQEELAAIRGQKTGIKKFKAKKFKAPSSPETIRHRLGLTQDAFAGFMGVSVQTLRNWEQGTRQPRGPALAFLWNVEKNPEVLFN